jgi:hypothetical protein
MRLLSCLLLTSSVFLFALSATAFAEADHDRTQFGHSITIGPGEEASDVTCFGCSVHVRGHVAGDVATFGGGVVVEDQGQIDGDLATFGGDLRLEKDATVKGDVAVFGGRIRRDPEAVVKGDITNMASRGWIFLIFGAPFIVLGLFVWGIVWIVRRLTRQTVPVAA